jgi:PAS domain-containing protein
MPGIPFRCLPDRQWTMTFISPGIEELSGYPAGDFINNRKRSIVELIHPDDRDRHMNS